MEGLSETGSRICCEFLEIELFMAVAGDCSMSRIVPSGLEAIADFVIGAVSAKSDSVQRAGAKAVKMFDRYSAVLTLLDAGKWEWEPFMFESTGARETEIKGYLADVCELIKLLPTLRKLLPVLGGAPFDELVGPVKEHVETHTDVAIMKHSKLLACILFVDVFENPEEHSDQQAGIKPLFRSLLGGCPSTPTCCSHRSSCNRSSGS
jgi:hypothetical protein